ncbi:hypothetical protein ACFOSV_03100 [Algoriphagus namhaensis]|uniref:Lipoprotein n=1 Tax=Algoriphagus namhaensis TaxID=915353 RepID=A0ABV8AP96_9BACT
MKTLYSCFLAVLLSAALISCSCEPEDIARFAVSGMESMLGEGFIPSEEIRQLGEFQNVSVNLSQNKSEGLTESTIFLKLENGDPVLLGNQPEVLARKCAELYIRDFEKSADYDIITVQFIQIDPMNSENIAMQEHTFQIEDFKTQ